MRKNPAKNRKSIVNMEAALIMQSFQSAVTSANVVSAAAEAATVQFQLFYLPFDFKGFLYIFEFWILFVLVRNLLLELLDLTLVQGLKIEIKSEEIAIINTIIREMNKHFWAQKTNDITSFKQTRQFPGHKFATLRQFFKADLTSEVDNT